MARRKKDFDQMNVEELREEATKADIQGRSSMNKDELVAALKGEGTEQEETTEVRDTDDPTECADETGDTSGGRAEKKKVPDPWDEGREQQSDEQDKEDQSAAQDKAPDPNRRVDDDTDWNPPTTGNDPSAGGLPPDSERLPGSDYIPPNHANTQVDPRTGRLRRIPRNHPDYDPRQDSLSTNPTLPTPPQPKEEDWPDPLEPSAAEKRRMEERGKEEDETESGPKQAHVGSTGPFVRLGNRLINMAHVLVVNISSASDTDYTMTLSMAHGGALSLNCEEACALMHVLGDCCSQEMETRKAAISGMRDRQRQQATGKKVKGQATPDVKKAPKPQGPSRAEREG